jgi:hypothetical protein
MLFINRPIALKRSIMLTRATPTRSTRLAPPRATPRATQQANSGMIGSLHAWMHRILACVLAATSWPAHAISMQILYYCLTRITSIPKCKYITTESSNCSMFTSRFGRPSSEFRSCRLTFHPCLARATELRWARLATNNVKSARFVPSWTIMVQPNPFGYFFDFSYNNRFVRKMFGFIWRKMIKHTWDVVMFI